MNKPLKSRGLVWDIENSAFIIDAWGVWQADAIHIRAYPQVLTVAWQWVGEKKIHVKGQNDFDGYRAGVNDDTNLVKFIWKLLDECDYAVAHNGDQHDVKILNARMMLHGLPQPSPYKQVDTKKIYKRVGKFGSNSLKNLAKQFSLDNQKGNPGSYEDTWLGCLAGNHKAWNRMKKYNKQDIPPLMDLYLISRPWDKQGVPLNILEDRLESCPHCSEGPLQKRGSYFTKSGTIQNYWCLNCHGWSKTRVNKVERPEYIT